MLINFLPIALWLVATTTVYPFLFNKLIASRLPSIGDPLLRTFYGMNAIFIDDPVSIQNY
jgi:hypothetical protein